MFCVRNSKAVVQVCLCIDSRQWIRFNVMSDTEGGVRCWLSVKEGSTRCFSRKVDMLFWLIESSAIHDSLSKQETASDWPLSQTGFLPRGIIPVSLNLITKLTIQLHNLSHGEARKWAYKSFWIMRDNQCQPLTPDWIWSVCWTN